MEQSELNLPPPSELPNSDIIFPYFVVGDDAFAIRKWFMKPISAGRNQLTDHEHEFNYRSIFETIKIVCFRISRARRVVEQAFGILVKRFHILSRAIQMNKKYLNTFCVL